MERGVTENERSADVEPLYGRRFHTILLIILCVIFTNIIRNYPAHSVDPADNLTKYIGVGTEGAINEGERWNW